MVREDTGDGCVEFGEPDGLAVEDLLDGEVEPAVAAEQAADPQATSVRGADFGHEDSGRSVIPDAVTEQIALFLDALEEELTNEESGNSTGGDIASQMLRMVTAGEQTELSIALGAVRLMALEWDIDAHAAPQLFELGK